MRGTRHSVTGADGVRIGLLTAGSGPPLLLVHGGMSSLEAWAGAWDALAAVRRVTALDRRGRGSSGDGERYSLDREFADVAAVAAALAGEHGGPVDAAGHSIGATCLLGAAALGAPLRRLVLYEPPGPPTVAGDWPSRLDAQVAEGQLGQAVFGFLTEIIGLAPAQVAALRDAPGSQDALSVAAATLPREARALASADLVAAGRQVKQPVRLLLGEHSPPWARQLTDELAAVLPAATVAALPGVGHEGLQGAPGLVAAEVLRFLDG